jgi:hypothetical protein
MPGIDPHQAADLRIPRRWGRAAAILALLLSPVAVLEWPWSFLPLRWQYYSEISEAERVIEVVEGFRSASTRLPTPEELAAALQRAVIPRDHFYEADGDHYSLIGTASFDWMITYDSRTRAWRRQP